MVPGATPSTPTREDADRLLAGGSIGVTYEHHILAALLRIEDLLTSSQTAEAPAPTPVVEAEPKPTTKRRKRGSR